MAPKNNRHVVPNPEGGWDVRAPGSDRSSGHFDRQAEAIDRARDIIRNAGGGELHVHGENGQIRAKDTISPAKDTYPPKG